MLTIIDDITKLSAGSQKEVKAICNCGREILLPLKKAIKQSTCGKCTRKPREWWLSQKWGNLVLDPNQDLPNEWAPGTHVIFNFLCDCGKSYHSNPQRLLMGRAVTCGKCNDLSIKSVLQMSWNKMRLSPEQNLPSFLSLKSNKSFDFLCVCGRKIRSEMYGVFTGNSKSCGKCSWKSKEYWLQQTWGNLKLDPNQELPDEFGVGASLNVKAICFCKRRFFCRFKSITLGNTTSCGKCTYKPKKYWLSQRWGNLVLDPNQDLPEEIAPYSLNKYWFLCQCNENKKRRKRISFGEVASNGQLSCGCLLIGRNDFSPANKIADWIKTLTKENVILNDRVALGNRKELDIYIPYYKLAIEYHGLIWHSEKFSPGIETRKKDHEKFLLANQNGIRLLQIYQDEWELKGDIICSQIKGIIAPEKAVRIKPIYTAYLNPPTEAREFLDKHHYLGAAGGCLTVAARHGEAIIGVWVFMKRETGVILWHRACWDHAFKTWNPHEKALHMALPYLKEMGFTKMVTFSDNRFHTGNLYEKLGFKFEKEIPPEYYYTNGIVRKSKYSLRVKAGINEVESAAKDGWYRIWDSGKKRYSMSL